MLGSSTVLREAVSIHAIPRPATGLVGFRHNAIRFSVVRKRGLVPAERLVRRILCGVYNAIKNEKGFSGLCKP